MPVVWHFKKPYQPYARLYEQIEETIFTLTKQQQPQKISGEWLILYMSYGGPNLDNCSYEKIEFKVHGIVNEALYL